MVTALNERSRTYATPSNRSPGLLDQGSKPHQLDRKTRLYALIAEGRLKVIKVGRRTLVNAASLRELTGTN